MVRQKIWQDLQKAVKDLGYPAADVVLSIPKNPAFGDYSTNVALQLAKQTRDSSYQSSDKIANEIVARVKSQESSKIFLEEVKVVNGFINFFIKQSVLAADLQEILDKENDFGKSETGRGKKARVEFVSANPTGPLHFGNARGGPIGDSLANVLEFVGFEVLREYYDNNIGGQVKKLGETIVNLKTGGKLEDQEYKGEYVRELAAKIAAIEPDEVGKEAVKLIFEEILKDCKDLGITFDQIYHESDFVKTGATKKALEELKNKGFLKEYEGATWFAPKDEFLQDRECVVIKSDGEYTYFANDIAYHQVKFSGKPDLGINILGANHHGHVPRLQAAITSLGFDAKRYKVILYQWVRFKKSGELIKMSKRSGTFITAREVLDEVGKDALRFSLLQYSPSTHIDLDLDLYKQKNNKNPVFYVQYAHARMVNILKKSQRVPPEARLAQGGKESKSQAIDYGLLKDSHELNLIKHLLYFPDLVEQIAQNLQINLLTEYATVLADLFHSFYEICPVLQAEPKIQKARLALVKSSQITLANTLKILGVSAPERM